MKLKKGESRQLSTTKQAAVIVKFEDIGMFENKFGVRAKCRIVYVLDERGANGRRKRMSQTLTASLHEKSTLTALLTQLLGDVPDEFDSDVLIGKQVILELGREIKDGWEIVRLCGVEAAPEG